MISKEDIQAVNSKMDVIDILSRFIHLKKKGANYIGNCPFHNEKTGSFTVSPAKQIYKCFGCGKSGNAITFVMEYEKYSYSDTIKWIGEKVGLEIKDVFNSEEERQKATESESLFIINKVAAAYFFTNLPNVPDAFKYVTDRGISKESITEFGIGYCGDLRDGFSNYVENNHYSLTIAATAGLCREKDGKFYDSYYSRLIFPIHNLTGKVIGFGGRILANNDKVPKYINTPENAIYVKSNVLYGLYQSRSEIVKQDEAILVEGYTDVILMYQNGIKNVVASSGTALTESQIRTIRRFSKNITMLYDGDNAGLKAVIRGIDLAISEGMSVRICILPEGEDPDSFIKKHGKEYVTEYINSNKKDIVDFYIDIHDTSTPENKDKALKEISKLIIKVGEDNHFKKQHYIQKVCTVFGITPHILSKYIVSVDQEEKGYAPEKEGVIENNKSKEPVIHSREKQLTKLLLKYGHLAYTNEKLVADEIIIGMQLEPDEYYTPNEITLCVLNKYREVMATGEIPGIDVFIADENINVSEFAASIAIEDDLISLNWNDSLKSSSFGYKEEVKIALGLYYISHCKMNLYMLHNKVDKSDPQWNEITINVLDTSIKKNIRDKAAELGLSNFKF